MSRSFRYVPPEPRTDSLLRPRLLRSMAGRWSHRAVSVIGGPGLGKTTLLAQAIAENQIAPHGEDIWIGLEGHDSDADSLARAVASAVADGGSDEARYAGHERPTPEPAAVADTLWQRSPNQACLVLDDVHRLPPRSSGAEWLTELVDHLPSNGHLVLSSRAEPPVKLSRLKVHGSALRLAEEDLRFSPDELNEFATQLGMDPALFTSTGGWPAMVELTASVEHHLTGKYLWEEVLDPLGTAGRRTLAILSDLGGADDALASAVLGTPVQLTEVLAGVPLVARGADGWHTAHALWRSAPDLALDPDEQASIRRLAIDHLRERGRIDKAFELIEEVDLWDEAPATLRTACLAKDRLSARQLRRWLAASPSPVRSSPAGRLASGLYTAFTEPSRAAAELQSAVLACASDNDIEAELAALAELCQLAWWRQDPARLAELRPRVVELARTADPSASALDQFTKALQADLFGNDSDVLSHFDNMERCRLDPAWENLVTYLGGTIRFELGDPDAASDIVARRAPQADPNLSVFLDGLELRVSWIRGDVDRVAETIPRVLETAVASGVAQTLYEAHTTASMALSHLGRLGPARRSLADGLAAAPPLDAGTLPVRAAVAQASVQLAEGDEDAATATLRAAIDAHGLDEGLNRRAWRQTLPLSYILLPETRDHWASVASGGIRRVATELARAVVAARESHASGKPPDLAFALPLTHPRIVRPALHFRFAAELAIGLSAAGHPEGRKVLDTLGEPGREAARQLTHAASGAPPPEARAAKALLAAVPAQPPRVTYLGVLGPLELRRDAPDREAVNDPDLRRKRVQALLAFLTTHRKTSRDAIVEKLWPDLDERSAANNLGVNLNHLQRILEPWRARGEAGYLLRLEGQAVRLFAGNHLVIDTDVFDDHRQEAEKAEADGVPSAALEHHLAAVELYRGDLHLDVPEADWCLLDREHYRTRFVATAIRAGELLVGRGETDRAQAIAHRALTVDPWSEKAYVVLVGSTLARGDQSGARRLLTHCLEMVNELGTQPSEPIRQLQRRAQEGVFSLDA